MCVCTDDPAGTETRELKEALAHFRTLKNNLLQIRVGINTTDNAETKYKQKAGKKPVVGQGLVRYVAPCLLQLYFSQQMFPGVIPSCSPPAMFYSSCQLFHPAF